MKENTLFNKIFELINNSNIHKDIKADPLSINFNESSAFKEKEFNDDLSNNIISFFHDQVIPFGESLKTHSNEISKTLDFDFSNIYKYVALSSENISKTGQLLIEGIQNPTSKRIKQLFRYILWPWTKESYFLSTGLLKPRGFPGDYLIVESMYEGNPKSLGLGYIYDEIFLHTQLCQGLRNRKNQMKQIILNYCSISNKSHLDIFNVGCGGSRELREQAVLADNKNFDIFLMDFDKGATDFSIHNLKSKYDNSDFFAINSDVRELIKPDNLKGLQGRSFDLIYSIGLFDYLPDKMLSGLIGKLFNLLNNKGLFVFAHKDYTLYNPVIADWFCDWAYYPRTADDLASMLNGLNIDKRNVSFSREKDGYIYFIEILK